MTSLDRGMLNDRLDAIGRGEFDPATGEFAQGFGPGGRGGFGGHGGGAGGGPGGRGGFGYAVDTRGLRRSCPPATPVRPAGAGLRSSPGATSNSSSRSSLVAGDADLPLGRGRRPRLHRLE